MNKCAALLAVMVLLIPAQAQAHAHLTRSLPADAAHVDVSPSVIRLLFSESPEVAMTFARLTDAGGKEYSLGPGVRDASNSLEISFAVPVTLEAGKYSLMWRTAASDGHPSRGKMSFVVASPPALATVQPSGAAVLPPASTGSVVPHGVPAPIEPAQVEETPVDTDEAASPANAIARAMLFAGILGLLGTIAFSTIVLRRAVDMAGSSKELMMRRAAIFGIAAGVVVLIAGVIRLYLELQMMNAMPDMPGMKGMGWGDMVMHTAWGFAFRIQMASAVLAVVALFMASRGMRNAWYIAALAGLALAIAPALGGHAAASPRFTAMLVATDWLHVIAGSTWLGSLLSVMVVGVPVALSLEGSNRWTSVASLVNAFSPLALVSAAVLSATGVFAGWVHLGRVSALLETGYGQTLLVKLALVALTFVVGAYNFRSVQPRLTEETGTMRLRRSAAVELTIGALIILATGVLTGIAP